MVVTRNSPVAVAADHMDYEIATKPAVSPNKPKNHRGLLSLDFPLPRPGKDFNATLTDGRAHTGVWQRGRPMTATDAAVFSMGADPGSCALPNGYYNAVQLHGRVELPGGERFARHGIGKVPGKRFSFAGVQPAPYETSAYARQYGASIFGTWANATGPILATVGAPAVPALPPPHLLPKQRPTGFTMNSPTKGHVAPGAPPLSPSALPPYVDAAYASERFRSASFNAYTTGHISHTHARASVAPFAPGFRTGYAVRAGDAKASDNLHSLDPPSLHPTQAALRKLGTPFDTNPHAHKTARLQRGL